MVILMLKKQENILENAELKAKAAFEKYKIPSIGDDSGLESFQLNGEPGIYSARYAGEDADDEKNNLKLIKKLSTLPEPHYGRFYCAAVFTMEKILNFQKAK